MRARTPPSVLLLLACAGVSGCANWDVPFETTTPLVEPHPYFVCIAPPRVVPGDRTQDSTVRMLPVDASRIARELERRLEEDNVFVEVSVLDAEVVTETGDGAADAERATVEAARELGADLVLSTAALEVPRYAFSRRTNWFVPNTILWFVLGFPSWWVRDRVYDVDWSVAARVRFVNADRAPIEFASRAFRAEVELSASEQGIRWPALVTPPGFYEGPDTPDVLTPVAEEIFVGDVVAMLKNSVIESSDVRIEAPERDAATGGMVVSIRSTRALARVVIRINGRVVLEHSPLDMPAPESGASGEGERVYRFAIPPAAESEVIPGALLHVRVLARSGSTVEFPVRDGTFSASRTFRVGESRRLAASTSASTAGIGRLESPTRAP